MTLLHLLVLVPLVQSPGAGTAPGEVGKFRWPPKATRTLQYTATFTKERKLPRDLQKAERAARKAAGLYAPSRPPKQKVELGMEFTLKTNAQGIEGIYATKLLRQSLRLDVKKPKKAKPSRSKSKRGAAAEASYEDDKAVAFLSNARIPWVWGLPASKGEDNVEVPLAALERKIDQRFRHSPKRGAIPEDLRTQFGDHLLPVLWVYPIPCWIGDLVHTLDLNGEAVIEGKQLLAESTQQLKLGYRRTSVDGMFTQGSESGFTIKYKIEVKQNLSQTRAGAPRSGSATNWHFKIEGLAKYSFRDSAWEAIDEKVTARPEKLDATRLKNLHDEVFSGTIKIRRKGTTGKPRKKRRRR